MIDCEKVSFMLHSDLSMHQSVNVDTIMTILLLQDSEFFKV